MRNLHYKVFSFRLNDKTVEAIKQIKLIIGTSHNLLFVDFIKAFKKSAKFKDAEIKIKIAK